MNKKNSKPLEYVDSTIAFFDEEFPIKLIDLSLLKDEPLLLKEFYQPAIARLAIATLNDMVRKLEERIVELEKTIRSIRE